MSETKQDINAKYLPNATTITNKSLEMFPNVKHFFKTQLKDTKIKTKDVGRSYRYHDTVVKHGYFPAHGIFMDYFIRKHLSNQYDVEIRDSRTEHVLKNADDYIIGENKSLRNSIKKHYEIFKDSKTKAMEIIKSIKIVSLSHLIFFDHGIPRHNYTVNEENLREIIKYFENLPYKSVDLNPNLDCDYFNGDADLIFDNDIIFELKTSKHKSLTNNKKIIPLSKFYQPIIYGFGVYKKTGIKVKHYKMYNPLLGDEFSIELNNINYELFEKVLQHDVALYTRLQALLFDEIVLDLSLFSTKEDK